MSFTAVVTSHAYEQGLRAMLGNLYAQTRRPDVILAVISDTPNVEGLASDFPEVDFVPVENEEDWGHAKRALGIELAHTEWIGFFNDDDSYDSSYVEKMLAKLDETGADVVYCSWNENPGGGFRLYEATAGSFIVSTALAKEIGWNERCYEADGIFINALVAAGAEHAKVGELLYTHNATAR